MTAHIQRLDPHVADLIAAGEVVERPASVVKELMENAVDAGAGSITVEIQHGGMTLIRVTDDGCGIAAAEAPTAFLRHATSKLRAERDLEAIGTLGFRGEALAAISAVSRIELLTRARGTELGTSLTLEGGVVIAQEEAGCPQGTTIVVRDLFYNTPARLKFIKKDAAEGAACFAVVQRLALSHPEIGIKFLRDGRQELLTPGDARPQSALYAVLGRDLALGFLPVQGAGEDMCVSGFATRPACCRGTRGHQFFFVNGRYVKSRTMMAALEEAYANQKMVGKFPGCVLYLTCRLSTVDVNVHPTKQEVKFGSDRRVFDAVYYAVRAALDNDCARPSAVAAPRRSIPPVPPKPAEQRGGFHSMTVQELRQKADWSAPALPLHDVTAPKAPIPAEPAFRPAPAAEQQRPCVPAPAGEKEETPAVRREEDAQEIPQMPPAQSWRMAGEVLDTYIIVEQGDKVLFIDKHASHERLQFDRLKAEGRQIMVQALLSPLVFTPPMEEGAALLAHLPLLSRFGFEVEDFGGGAVIVRSAPSEVDAGEIEGILTALGEELLSTGRADPESARDVLMHTIACKAAIKGGQKNSREELLKVARAVMDGQVKYCPHGRPVAIELTRAQLEQRFGRS